MVLRVERVQHTTLHKLASYARTPQSALIQKGKFGNESIPSQSQFASHDIGRIDTAGGQTVLDHGRGIALELLTTHGHNLFDAPWRQRVVAILGSTVISRRSICS
jgi:hypothetical protein